jgi:hypothetical protein
LECLDRLAATTNKSRLREETTPEGHRCAGGNRRWGRIVQTRQASKQERKIDDGAAAAERKERLCLCMGFFSSLNGMRKRQEIKNTNKSITDNYLGRTVIT